MFRQCLDRALQASLARELWALQLDQRVVHLGKVRLPFVYSMGRPNISRGVGKTLRMAERGLIERTNWRCGSPRAPGRSSRAHGDSTVRPFRLVGDGVARMEREALWELRQPGNRRKRDEVERHRDSTRRTGGRNGFSRPTSRSSVSSWLRGWGTGPRSGRTRLGRATIPSEPAERRLLKVAQPPRSTAHLVTAHVPR